MSGKNDVELNAILGCSVIVYACVAVCFAVILGKFWKQILAFLGIVFVVGLVIRLCDGPSKKRDPFAKEVRTTFEAGTAGVWIAMMVIMLIFAAFAVFGLLTGEVERIAR